MVRSQQVDFDPRVLGKIDICRLSIYVSEYEYTGAGILMPAPKFCYDLVWHDWNTIVMIII